jgi:hypothetical protein
MTAPLPRPAPTAAAAARDPAWLPHRYDPQADAVHFRSVPRAVRDRVTFLIDEHLPAGPPLRVVRRADAVAAAPPPAPLHFVFHSAFCCSTMIARAFDRPGWATSLREPVILNDLTGWRRRREPGPDMAEVLDDVLGLLARPFAAGEAVVAKPSSVFNALAPAALALRPDARALLLRAPLRTFLGSVAKKGIDGRLWVRTALTGLLDDGAVNLGFGTRDYLGQTDLQVAAVGWLAQQAIFAGLVARYGAGRVRTLDSETLLRDPAAAMRAVAALFGLPLDEAGVAAIVAGPAFTRHSKLDTDFAAGDRAAEHRDAAAIHADEIDKVFAWAQAVAKAAGVALDAPAPLV